MPFTSALSLGVPEHRDIIHIIYGLSKDFGAAGLRIGALISRNRALHQPFWSIIRFHSPSGPSVAIATKMLESREWCGEFIRSSRLRIASAFRLATDELERIQVRFVSGVNSGFFVYIDLSHYLPPAGSLPDQDREFTLAAKLLGSGVFLHPGKNTH